MFLGFLFFSFFRWSSKPFYFREILELSKDITMFQAFNILRYEVGQLYKSHYDAFSPAEYGPQKSQRVHLKQKNFLFFIVTMELFFQ